MAEERRPFREGDLVKTKGAAANVQKKYAERIANVNDDEYNGHVKLHFMDDPTKEEVNATVDVLILLIPIEDRRGIHDANGGDS